MKLLFLDVDGVLNYNSLFLKEETSFCVCDDRLKLLKTIVEQTDCKIVLSSTWRLFPQYKRFLRDAFMRHQIPLWIDQTPIVRDAPRRQEIVKFLKRNRVFNPSISNIAILDDDSDAWLASSSLFFRTDPSKGLTQEICDKVIERLNK